MIYNLFLNEEFKEILDLAYYDEFRKTDYMLFDKRDVCGIFNISDEELERLIYRLTSTAKIEGFKKGLDKCIFEDDISIVGMYLICFYNQNSENELFKRYLSLFSNFSLWFLIKFMGNIPSEKTERKNSRKGSMPGTDYEELMIMSSTKKIASNLKQMNTNVEDTSHIFYQKKVVITGSFDRFPIRNDMAKLLYDVGADINTSISTKTDYVIVGENAGPKKLEKIAKLGIEIISEKKFLELFNL